MRKTSSTNLSSERMWRVVAAIALSGTLAVFGCTTNRTPGYGEPARTGPAAGPYAPNVTSTPGSAYGGPAMISSSASPANGVSASVDAIATLKANEAFQGKNLGPAAGGNNSQPSQSMLQPTGQLNIPQPPPTIYATTPPMIVGDVVGGAVIAAGPAITGSATVAPATIAGTTAPVGTGTFAAAGGATGLSNTTATPILTATGPFPGVSATTAPATVTGGATVGIGTVTAGVAPSTATTTTTPTVASSTITTRSAGGVAIANPAAGMTSAFLGASTAPATSDRLTLGTTAPVIVAPATAAPARTRAVRVGTAATGSGSVRIDSTSGSVVVTNSSASGFRQFVNSLASRRTQ